MLEEKREREEHSVILPAVSSIFEHKEGFAKSLTLYTHEEREDFLDFIAPLLRFGSLGLLPSFSGALVP